MKPIPFSEASAEFRRFYQRVERRVDKVRGNNPYWAELSDTVEHDWRGGMDAWEALVATPQGQQEAVWVQKARTIQNDDGRADTLLNLAIHTGHGTLVEKLLCLHDTLDRDKAWTRRIDESGMTPIMAYPLPTSVLLAIATRDPEGIGPALDKLFMDCREAVDRRAPHTYRRRRVAIETWQQVALRSKDIVLPQIQAWMGAQTDMRLGEEELDGALDRLRSLVLSQTLQTVAAGVRPEVGATEPKARTPKL